MSVLGVPMRDNDAGAETIGEYLAALLTTLWREEQGFSGKRPFGNSGWQYDVYVALADAGVVDAERDVYDEGGPDEYVDYKFDWGQRSQMDELIINAVKDVFTRSDNAN